MDYKNKTALVTGGTGSFGSIFIQHLLKAGVSQVICLSRDEKKQSDLRADITDSRLRFVIADVRDPLATRAIFDRFDFDLVIHCAAMKQVPACEQYPREAYLTNVVGSQNIKDACLATGVRKLILLSTDKAVHPVNTMGLTKALAEKTMIGDDVLSQDRLKVVVTRYGNVLSSRGSVIPLFVSLLRRREALPITNISMTRFLMSLQESIELVDKAIADGKNGEIFVKRQPATDLVSLVESIGRLMGVSADWAVTGVRPGEKLHEQLISDEEMLHVDLFEDYFRIGTTRLLQESIEPTEDLVFLEQIRKSDTTTKLSGESLDQFLLERLGQQYFRC